MQLNYIIAVVIRQYNTGIMPIGVLYCILSYRRYKEYTEMIRQQKTKSGRLLEIDSFPVWNDGRRVSSRAPKAKPSTEEQKRYNKNKLRKSSYA